MSGVHDPSGHALAEAAHAAGAVEPAATLPNCDVDLSFVVRGTREHAEAVAATLAYELSARSDVDGNVTYSVAVRS